LLTQNFLNVESRKCMQVKGGFLNLLRSMRATLGTSSAIPEGYQCEVLLYVTNNCSDEPIRKGRSDICTEIDYKLLFSLQSFQWYYKAI
jgi:hypothetical protein